MCRSMCRGFVKTLHHDVEGSEDYGVVRATRTSHLKDAWIRLLGNLKFSGRDSAPLDLLDNEDSRYNVLALVVLGEEKSSRVL